MAEDTQGFFLTQNDGEIIRQVVQDYRRTPKGQPSYGLPEGLDGYPPDDLFAPECYVAEIPAGGIPPRDGITPGSALCNIWRMFLTVDEDDEYLVDVGFQVKVRNLSTEWITGDEIQTGTGTGTGTPQRFQLTWRDKFGRWYTENNASNELVELCAQETAERNVPYECLKGTWDPDLGLYCYAGAATVYAIDHRMGAPHAEEGWKGLYQAMPSTVPAHNGLLYVCVSLDCVRPDEGCSCAGTGTGA